MAARNAFQQTANPGNNGRQKTFEALNSPKGFLFATKKLQANASIQTFSGKKNVVEKLGKKLRRKAGKLNCLFVNLLVCELVL